MIRRKKPFGWPPYMTAKRLASGRIAYYWQPPSWARKRGCPATPEALGTDYGTAKQRCDDVLNPHFHAWLNPDKAQSGKPIAGTFDWMAAEFRLSPQYRDLALGTRLDYDRALQAVAEITLKDGRRIGGLPLRNITPGVADKLHERQRGTGDIKRHRKAKLGMDVCRRAWNVAYRNHPNLVPYANPFTKMGIRYKPSKTRAATHTELMTFVAKADEMGYPSLGTAALLAFNWLVRVEDIFLRFGWARYRPPHAVDTVVVDHHKTGEQVLVPLYDEDGSELWPGLIERLDAAPRHGPLIVMRDHPDRRWKIHLPWATSAENPVRHVQSIVAKIRDAAGLPLDITFTSFRHGGHTDAANAGLTDRQIMALSGHRNAAMVALYAKETRDQRLAGARKRRSYRRTERGRLSE
ncbi:MAG: tyrosine-type recombinase/integrase [Hyphomicrobiales bacterium]